MNHPTLFDLGGNTSFGGKQPPLPANLPDICANKHKGNTHSVQANTRLHPHKTTAREQVLRFVQSCCGRGATLSETAEHLGKLPHQLSGRFSELLAKQEIQIRGSRQNSRGNEESVYFAG